LTTGQNQLKFCSWQLCTSSSNIYNKNGFPHIRPGWVFKNILRIILRTFIMYGCLNGATTIVTFSKTIKCNYVECHIFFCYAEYRDADLTTKGSVKRRFQPDVRQTFLKYDNEVILWIPTLGVYSQCFIFILTYKWVQYARMLHFESLARDKHQLFVLIWKFWKIWAVVNMAPGS